MNEAQLHLDEQYDDPEQQQKTALTGMWVFLATEILFFGGLFMTYIVYRSTYPADFSLGVSLTDHLLGSMDAAILLASSFTMVLALHAIQHGRQKALVLLLLFTILLGLSFLSLKGLEYHEHIVDHLLPGRDFNQSLPRPVQMFFVLYFVMTGLHALHMSVGIGLLAVMTIMAYKSKFSADYYNPIEVCGLYWSFVDIIWIWLYPLFYVIHWKG
jgi:cytochrome c oxidase subunit III